MHGQLTSGITKINESRSVSDILVCEVTSRSVTRLKKEHPLKGKIGN